ncbi:MAG: two-component system sensor histidine kinase NtrB [Treponema sp.]
MREFVSSAMKKLSRMNEVQLRSFIHLVADEYALFDAMMDSLSTGVIILDSQQRVVKSNKAAVRILGIPIVEGDDRPFWKQLHHQKIAAFIRTVIKNEEGKKRAEFTVVADAGNQYIDLSVAPLVRDKKVKGTIITCEDTTQKKREEINRIRLENLASLTNLAAAVAHEIKNPLGAISIHVQLLRKNFKTCNTEISSKAQKHLDVVDEEIARLNTIVVDFLFAVRPLQCTFAPVCMNEVIDTLIATFSEEFQQAGVQLRLQLEKHLPYIQADERFMRQALMNILTNAKAAMPAGGVLTVATFINDDKLCIRISDTGCGIPAEVLHKIFEPYFTTKADGSGLGLTMTYKVIKEHGGDIQVHSEADRGTCFTISLPLSRTACPLLIEAHRAGERV